MENINKRIDMIKTIDKKNDIIAKNLKLIDNVFLNKLYRNYLLAQRKNRYNNNNKLKYHKTEKKKLAEKIIINRVVKNIPPYLLQYYNDFEFKKYANQLIVSEIKKKKKAKKQSSSQKSKGKIYSRNESGSSKMNKICNNQNNTYNDGNTLKMFDSEEDKNTNNNNNLINHKKYYLSNSFRKNSANIYRNHYTTIYDNLAKETQDNNKVNNNHSYYDKIYTTMSSKNNKYISSIFNTNNSVNNITDDESHVKPLSSNNLNQTNYNIESKIKYIKDYKNIKKSKKLVLNISNSNEKSEKKFDSRILLSSDRRNVFNLPKRKIKNEIVLKSLSPKEVLITNRASNILNNLNEIKMEIKSDKKNTTTNIKQMINTVKKDKNKDTQYIRNEVQKNKFYDYFMKNKKEMEKKQNDIFKILRKSFNTERIKRTSNELSFIKTLNHICQQEKHFDSVVKHVYRQNYWLRLNKNKKIAENMKNRINKMNAHYVQLNTLVTKINKLQIKHSKDKHLYNEK